MMASRSSFTVSVRTDIHLPPRKNSMSFPVFPIGVPLAIWENCQAGPTMASPGARVKVPAVVGSAV
jgi:hypothetical protein